MWAPCIPKTHTPFGLSTGVAAARETMALHLAFCPAPPHFPPTLGAGSQKTLGTVHAKRPGRGMGEKWERNAATGRGMGGDWERAAGQQNFAFRKGQFKKLRASILDILYRPRTRRSAGLGTRTPGPLTKVFRLRFCAAPQLRDPAGLRCSAPGTSYKGIPFGLFRGPAAARPRRFKVRGPRDLVQRHVF